VGGSTPSRAKAHQRVITSIRAASRTIADLLQREFEADPDLSALFKAPGTMRVWLNTPAEMTGRAGLSVWLYRVVRDDVTANRPPVRISPTQVRPTPMPLRLHYLFAPMTGNRQDDAPETDQVILGKTLQVLNDHPSIGGADLSDDFIGTSTLVTSRFEPLMIEDLARIWEALDVSYRTSVSYEVTVVELYQDVPAVIAPPVRIPIVDAGVEVG
jgi:Pvc16 N-terminal domain